MRTSQANSEIPSEHPSEQVMAPEGLVQSIPREHSCEGFVESKAKTFELSIACPDGFGIDLTEPASGNNSPRRDPYYESESENGFSQNALQLGSCSLEEWRKEVCRQFSRLDKKIDTLLERDSSNRRHSRMSLQRQDTPTRAMLRQDCLSFPIHEDCVLVPPKKPRLSNDSSPPSSWGTPVSPMSPAKNRNSGRISNCSRRMSHISLDSTPMWGGKLSVHETIHNMDMIRKTVEAQKIEQQTLRSKIWAFTEKPYSSLGAYCYSIFVPTFVASGVGISLMKTVKGSPVTGATEEVLQTTYEIAFALELIVRFVVCPDHCEFIRSPFNQIDFLSASPLLVRLIGYTLEWTGNGGLPEDVQRGMSLVILLRLLRLARGFETLQLLLRAFRLALEALPVLLYILFFIALLFSALVYFVEPESNIESLPKALWFVIITMTTVGYGDTIPVTVAGHILVSMLSIFSSLYMAIPIGIVGNTFSEVWADRDRLLLIHRIRNAFLDGGFNSKSISDIFQLFDSDCSGELDMEEFELMLKTMQINISDERLAALFRALDSGERGHITLNDLVENLFPTKSAYFGVDDLE